MTESRPTRVAVSCLVALLAWPPSAVPAQTPRAVQSTRVSAPPIDALYAVAAARLLGPVGSQEFVILPTAAGKQHTVRARPGSGEAHIASVTTAQRVARLLAQRGYRGARAVDTPSAPLRFVLGALRFEPPDDPHFARLAIEVIGSNGRSVMMELLLKREAEGWRAIQMESEDNIG